MRDSQRLKEGEGDPKCSLSLSLSLLFPSCLIFLCFRVKTEKGGNRSTGVKDEGEREWEKWGKRANGVKKRRPGVLDVYLLLPEIRSIVHICHCCTILL